MTKIEQKADKAWNTLITLKQIFFLREYLQLRKSSHEPRDKYENWGLGHINETLTKRIILDCYSLWIKDGPLSALKKNMNAAIEKGLFFLNKEQENKLHVYELRIDKLSLTLKNDKNLKNWRDDIGHSTKLFSELEELRIPNKTILDLLNVTEEYLVTIHEIRTGEKNTYFNQNDLTLTADYFWKRYFS